MFLDLVTRIRQWSFPAEFRIAVQSPDGCSAAVEVLLGELTRIERRLDETRNGIAQRNGLENLQQRLEPLGRLEEIERRIAELAVRVPAAETATDAAGSSANDARANEDFAKAISNALHRLATASVRMSNALDDRQQKLLARALGRVNQALSDHGIECLDVTGERFPEGRKDFIAEGEPQRDPTITEPIIATCDQPVVRLHGKVIQRGRGSISIPN
jgi:hypothetical protein